MAIIGTYGSSLAMAGGEVAEKAGIPMVGTSCTNPLVTQGRSTFSGFALSIHIKEQVLQLTPIECLASKKRQFLLMWPMTTL